MALKPQYDTEMAAGSVAKVVSLRDELGRKLTAFDVEEAGAQMLLIAETYAYRYQGTFEFMQNMCDAMRRNGYLTAGQAAGTLNCLYAEERRRQSAEVTPVMEASTPVDMPVGYYTVEFENGHVTLRISEGSGGFEGRKIVSLLVGSDNTSDYLGMGDVMGSHFRLWRRSQSHPKAGHVTTAVSMLMHGTQDQMTEYGKAYARHSGNCYVCGRLLTTPESIAAGIGPVCAGRE
jgi:hypothetical protein